MRKICAVLFLSLFVGLLFSEPKLITLKELNVPLTDLIDQIGLNVTGLEAVYPDEKAMPKVTVLIRNLPDNQVLEAVCASLNLEATKSGEEYLVQRSRHEAIAAFDNGYQTDMQEKDKVTGDVSIKVDRELPLKRTEMDSQKFYREFNREITITNAIPDEKRIEFLFQGQSQSLVEGENFNDRIQLLEVLNEHEVLIYYPQMFIRLTVKVQNGNEVSSPQKPKIKAHKTKVHSSKTSKAEAMQAGGQK